MNLVKHNVYGYVKPFSHMQIQSIEKPISKNWRLVSYYNFHNYVLEFTRY
jgi:hypothetical protein